MAREYPLEKTLISELWRILMRGRPPVRREFFILQASPIN